MKLIHLADLHLGKRVNEFPMLEDQKHILSKILTAIDGESPDAVLIAGDIYDKSVPSTEAVELFDDFLVELASRKLQVFVISGNHDSPERLAFANRLIDTTGIHIASVYDGNIQPVVLQDAFGSVRIYMLPFVRPANVRRFFETSEILTYTDALRTAIGQMEIDGTGRNVLVTHQFVSRVTETETEDIFSVGGTDRVDAEVFDGFDYVALGHIHRAENIGSEKMRYCGSPLKYSFSETGQTKSLTVVELGPKGCLTVREVPLVPLHDMVEIRGKYEDLMKKNSYDGTSLAEDYVHITLLDEEDIPDAVNRMRSVYHNLMLLDYDNARTRCESILTGAPNGEDQSPLQLFSEFFKQQNGQELSEDQSMFLTDLIGKIWEVEK